MIALAGSLSRWIRVFFYLSSWSRPACFLSHFFSLLKVSISVSDLVSSKTKSSACLCVTKWKWREVDCEALGDPPIGHLVLEVAHFEPVWFICFFKTVSHIVSFHVCPRKPELRRLQMLDDVPRVHLGVKKRDDRSLPEGDLWSLEGPVR